MLLKTLVRLTSATSGCECGAVRNLDTIALGDGDVVARAILHQSHIAGGVALRDGHSTVEIVAARRWSR